MSLNYDLRDVQENEHTTSEETHNDGTIQKWGRWTETLIFATIWVDMGEITEKNHTEFYRRWRMMNRIKAWGDTYADLTVEVVKAHVGLKTNVSTTTAAAWKKKCIEMLEAEMYEERYQAERLAKK